MKSQLRGEDVAHGSAAIDPVDLAVRPNDPAVLVAHDSHQRIGLAADSCQVGVVVDSLVSDAAGCQIAEFAAPADCSGR